MLKVANSVIDASRITGVLPVLNGGTGVTTSTGTGNTVLSASPTLSGDVNFSTGNLVIGTAGKGIDFTAAGGGTLLYYEEFTAPSAACTGAITTSVVWKLTKIGNVVTLTLPTTEGATSASAAITYGTVLPARFRPTPNLLYLCQVKDAGTTLNTGQLSIQTNGTIEVYKAPGAPNYTASASESGFGSPFSISWTI